MPTPEDKEVSFMQACVNHFGKKPGETSLEFMAEIKALNNADRTEISNGLIWLGYKITVTPLK